MKRRQRFYHACQLDPACRRASRLLPLPGDQELLRRAIALAPLNLRRALVAVQLEESAR